MSNLDEQLAMTTITWEQLVAVGATDGSDLFVEFFYDAPTADAAEALARELEPSCITVNAYTRREGFIRRRDVSNVGGVVLVQDISQKRLLEWVEQMVRVGEQTGCSFDGWGAEPQEPGP